MFSQFSDILARAFLVPSRPASPPSHAPPPQTSESGSISVYNNGRGIPIEMHSKEKVWVPELIFGHLLTSSNYNDKEKKTTGGRNGYGAKLANIFSTEFTVETAHSKSGQQYKQVFSDNMTKGHGKGKVKKNEKGENWTKITFTPDLARFGMTELDDDIIALMTRRVYDMAGVSKGVKVSYNGKRIPINTFKDYCDMVLANSGHDFPVVHEIVNDRWEVCMTVSTEGFQQVSFVNSIATTKGGTHVNHVTDLLVKQLAPIIKKKNKSAQVKPHQIKSHLWVFVNCLIENPTFDSQTKETHTLAASKMGSKCTLSPKFMKEVGKTGVVDNILVWAKVKSQELMGRKTGGAKRSKLTGIAKLEDANSAGTKDSLKCTLILTEGDSAKSLAVSGLSVIGRDHFGVFPLKGKPLNVREATHSQIMANTEIKSIIEIMGLQIGKSYDDEKELKKLRYGRIMIMADQDQDGSHIKGLLINFIHHFWPSLLHKDGFLLEFITPIVKASKGKAVHTFFTLPEYETWCEEQTSLKGWAIKYYKGLGTSTAKEAKEYFSEMDEHQKAFEYTGEDDDTAIDMAFSKKKIEERKTWLRGFKPGTFLDHSVQTIPYSDFINQELILFSMADNVRSIPSMVDGFKPGQRKVLFACFKKNLTKDIKVAQLAGYISEHSAYHHGEMSLNGTIVNMAQTHIGSNNVALLYPSGQFGTRLQGGKDSASPRYIFTRLQMVSRMIFHPNDDQLLTTLEDDGQSIEPLWYLPVVPMVLVNGSDGIGTGWSSKVPTFNPREIVENLRLRMRGEPMTELLPWFRNFKGNVEADAKKKDRFRIRGTCTKIDETTIEITELPVREWTQDYKMFLEGLLTGEEAPGVGVSKAKAAKAAPKAPSIKDFKEYHTDTTVKFVLTLTEEQMQAAETFGLDKKFKMETTITTSNMVLFDSEGRLKKYSTANEIMEDFYTLRLSYYQKRKDHLAEKLTEEYTRLDNKVRFILALINDTLKIRNRPKAELLADMKGKGFTAFPKQKKTPTAGSTDEQDDEVDEDAAPGASDYDYLLSMPFWSLTMEKVDEFKSKRAQKEDELDALLAQSPEDIWNTDLDALSEELDILDATYESDEKTARKMAKAAQSGKGGKKKAKKTKKKKGGWDSDDSAGESEEEEDDWAPAAKKAKKKAPAAAAAKKVAAPAPVVAKPLVRPRSPTKVIEEDAATMSPAPKAAKKTASGAAARKKAAPKKAAPKKVEEDKRCSMPV